MTQIQWHQLESMIGAMTPEDKHRLVSMLSVPTPEARPAETPAGARTSSQGPKNEDANAAFVWDPSNPSLGLFADEPELIDEIMKYVYESRENDPLRASD